MYVLNIVSDAIFYKYWSIRDSQDILADVIYT